MTVRWNRWSYKCKMRRYQRLVEKCYFQTASPSLAVTIQGRMDTLKHLWHSALTISVTKSANVSSRMWRHYNLVQLHGVIFRFCSHSIQLYFRVSELWRQTFGMSRQVFSCKGLSICCEFPLMYFPCAVSSHKLMKVQALNSLNFIDSAL